MDIRVFDDLVSREVAGRTNPRPASSGLRKDPNPMNKRKMIAVAGAVTAAGAAAAYLSRNLTVRVNMDKLLHDKGRRVRARRRFHRGG